MKEKRKRNALMLSWVLPPGEREAGERLLRGRHLGTVAVGPKKSSHRPSVTVSAE